MFVKFTSQQRNLPMNAVKKYKNKENTEENKMKVMRERRHL